jgi:hypothetical protein
LDLVMQHEHGQDVDIDYIWPARTADIFIFRRFCGRVSGI